MSGQVEIDGAYFGGYVKPANYKDNRCDRRLSENRSGKRRVVVVMRERNGRTQSIVANSEHETVSEIGKWILSSSTIHADEAGHWDALYSRYKARRVNHAEAYSHNSDNGLIRLIKRQKIESRQYLSKDH